MITFKDLSVTIYTVILKFRIFRYLCLGKYKWVENKEQVNVLNSKTQTKQSK